ncbi:MAG: DUF1732 domain-containing protein, partial [Chitinophagaceae bacterium]
AKPITINTDLVKAYHHSLRALSEELGLETGDLLNTIIKLPEVITPSSETLTDAEWQQFDAALNAAIDNLNAHRADEGRSLKQDLELRIRNIMEQQGAVNELAPLRQGKIRENITKILEEQVGKENYDSNRLEQELIYYIEKIDISEEQVRLTNHCDYFMTVLNDDDPNKGKKLSFILQEIGREINTTGSKAYDHSIQKCVVQMKDELEKAKEQVLNVL